MLVKIKKYYFAFLNCTIKKGYILQIWTFVDFVICIASPKKIPNNHKHFLCPEELKKTDNRTSV